MRSRIFQVALALSAALLPCQRLFAESSTKAPLVLAAASLQESLNAIADRWANAGHVRPVIALAASSQLARQIEAGAPADLFISADEQWMDDVAAHGQIVPSTRLNLVGNALVLIAPVHAPQHVNLKYGASILSLLGGGRLAMADPDAVPAGIYGKAAMQNLGLWNSVRNRVAKGANVRSALLLVDREEAPLGIVYATDARADPNVMVAGRFPDTSHPPIRYPIARLKSSMNPEAEAFRHFLFSPQAQQIFTKYGFSTPR